MANDGKRLEHKVQEALVKYAKSFPSFMYRFYDTRSAGSFLPAQPGDFFLLTPKQCFLIECKSSELGTPLLRMANAKTKTASTQRAKHKLWRRAGHATLYVYLDLRTERLEWHNGSYVLEKTHAPLWVGHIKDIFISLTNVIAS